MRAAAVGPVVGLAGVGDRVVRGVEAGELVVRVGGLAGVAAGAATLLQDVGVTGGRQTAFVVGEAGPAPTDALPAAPDTDTAVPIEASDVDRLEHTGTAAKHNTIY